MVKKFIIFITLCLSCLISFMLWEMSNFTSKQIDVPPSKKVALNSSKVFENLSASLGYKTISHANEESIDAMTFLSFHKFLRRTYPEVFSEFSEQIFSGYSMLLKWESENQISKNPVLLMAHIDVVPEGEISGWDKDPFSGTMEDGVIFGRGAIDNKSSLMSIFEAFDYLISIGFQPSRDIYIALGHDEENGGIKGNAVIADFLKSEGVYFDMVLDEGSVITDGIIDGINTPLALIGIAEKGYVSMELTSTSEAGHSSMPGSSTAIGKLAGAINRIERKQMEPVLTEPVKSFFRYIGPELPGKDRFILSNVDLLSSTILNQFIKNPITASMVRTSVAPTVINSGFKSNVLPSFGTAVLNFRLLHGNSIAEVEEYLYHTVNDTDITIEIFNEEILCEASKVSSVDSPFFNLIHKTIKQTFSDLMVAPSLVMATTDSRHYQSISRDIYRFIPLKLTSDDLSMIHGYNEKIYTSDYLSMIQFYIQLVKNINVL